VCHPTLGISSHFLFSFELFNDSSITIKKFDNLLRLVQPGKVVTCYKYIQGVIDDSVAFAEKWLQYQVIRSHQSFVQ